MKLKLRSPRADGERKLRRMICLVPRIIEGEGSRYLVWLESVLLIKTWNDCGWWYREYKLL